MKTKLITSIKREVKVKANFKRLGTSFVAGFGSKIGFLKQHCPSFSS